MVAFCMSVLMTYRYTTLTAVKLWYYRETFKQHVKLHPAVLAGEITYTFSGSGDLWDMVCAHRTPRVVHSDGNALRQPTEPFWCPWTQDCDSYEMPIVGSGDALIDWSLRKDVARYVAATLAKPELSANAELNLPSTTLSQNEMLTLFRQYAGARGKSVKERHIAMDDVHRYIKDESLVPKDITQNTQIPVDFYFIVKCNEAQGLFRRNQWECHWDLFPEVKRTTFEDYLKERFGEL